MGGRRSAVWRDQPAGVTTFLLPSKAHDHFGVGHLGRVALCRPAHGARSLYGALIYLIFHLIITTGANVGNAALKIHFVIMILSAIAYLLTHAFESTAVNRLRHYHACLSLLQMAALLTFYLSGNYYVVQNIDASIHGEGTPIALSWLWWILTGIVPVIYVVAGIRKKDNDPLMDGPGLGCGRRRLHYPVLLPYTAGRTGNDHRRLHFDRRSLWTHSLSANPKTWFYLNSPRRARATRCKSFPVEKV